VQDFEIKKEPEKDDVEVLVEEFSSKRAPKQAASTMEKGVKVRGKYIARKKVIAAVVTVVVLLVLVSLFVPPFFTANDSESSCRKEDIFAKEGSTQYRSDIISNDYVYNIDALSSDRSDSYRICTVAFDAKNYTPFEVTADDYIISDGGNFSSNIVYSKCVGDSNVIPPFSTKTIRIEILINRDGLSDEAFDEAITSLTLRTTGTKKRIGKAISIPCIPAWFGVSDVISFDPDA
jgi:hypothetical protein